MRPATFFTIIAAANRLALRFNGSKLSCGDGGCHRARLIGHGEDPSAVRLAFQPADTIKPQDIVIDFLGTGGAATIGVSRLHQTADGNKLVDTELVDEASLVERGKVGVDCGRDISLQAELIIYLLIFGRLANHAVSWDRIVGAIQAIIDQVAVDTIGFGLGAVRGFHEVFPFLAGTVSSTVTAPRYPRSSSTSGLVIRCQTP